MPSALDVSVVVCAYTAARWDDLCRSLESLRRQRVPPREIVLVVDHDPALLERARHAFPDVVTVANRHRRGLSGARNTGLELTRGAITAFLDDDARADPDWIERLLAAYDDPAVAGVGGAIEPDWSSGRPAWFPAEFDWVVGCTYRGMPECRRSVRNLIGANMSFRTELFRDVGGFMEWIGRVGTRPLGCEETEFCIRVARLRPGTRMVLEPSARVRHRVPRERARWRYFASRCWAEGRSKALVAQRAGAGRALATERSYVTSTVTRGVARGLGDAVLRRDVSGLTRAGAIAAGVGITTAGYVAGSVRRPSAPAAACAAALALLAGAVGVPEARGLAGPLERVSVAPDGAEADAASLGPPAVAADGRYVAYASYAANLVPGDGNGVADVFVRDRATGAVDRVSVTSGGGEADRSSTSPALSADGRFVAFASNATNLVPDDTNRKADVFVHDRLTGLTERASVDSDEGQADFLPSGAPAISADGRFVAFESNASDLVPGDTNRLADDGTPGDVFVRDRGDGTTTRVSVDSLGREVTGISAAPSISASGRHVAFESDASALAPGDPGAERRPAVYLHDRITGATIRVSAGSGGTAADGESGRPALSASGYVVAFRSSASNLVPGTPADGTFRLYVRDLRRGSTALASGAVAGAVERAAVSGDGAVVAYATAPPLAPPDVPQPVGDVVVVDRRGGTAERIATPAGGAVADPAGTGPALSADGRVVAFASAAADLVAGDANGVADVFAAPVPRVAELRLEVVGPEPTAVRLSGAGFAAYEPLDVAFDGVRIAERAATVSGAPAGRVAVPAGTPPGAHEVSVTGRVSGAAAAATLVVSGPPVPR